jgi:hypothetical protein
VKAQSNLEGISKVNKKPPPTKERQTGPSRDSTSYQQWPRNSHPYTTQRDRYISNSPYSFGGQVSQFIDNWAKITSDPWVLPTVENGLSLDFISTPTQQKIPHNAAMNDQQLEICDTEISSLLRKGAITPSDGVVSEFRKRVVCSTKIFGGWMPIVNLKGLIQFIPHQHLNNGSPNC